MTKDEALKIAIDFLDGSYEAHAVRKALQEALATNDESLLVQPTIKESLKVEQPAQEPVAYLSVDKNNAIGRIMRIRRAEEEMDGKIIKYYPTPLYTHPAPAKEWVGLSYEEADGLILRYQHAPFKFVRAIEQALKEKNEK